MTPLPWPIFWIALLSVDPSPKSCVEGDPEDCRQTVSQGEETPFDGQLLTPRRAARLAVQAGQCQERTVEAVSKAVRLLEVDLSLSIQSRGNDKDHSSLTVGLLKDELVKTQEASERSFLESPILWFGIGVATTAALIGISVAIISETRPEIISVPIETSSALLTW